MGLLERGVACLARLQAVTDGITVTYSRGGVSATVIAVVGASPANTVPGTQSPTLLRYTERDYLIRAADLAAAGFGVPQEGDRITETIAGVAVTFRVARRSGDKLAWQWSDSAERTTCRLHTQPVT